MINELKMNELKNLFFYTFGIVPLQYYNAIGDGFTDNRLSIQQAIYDAIDVGAKYIFVPKGNYYYSETLQDTEQVIFIGNNVRVATNVTFVTHDVSHNMLNNLPEALEGKYRFKEKKGKIVIGDNVFIGANSLILYDVTIGNNVIVGAGSIITKDLPDNSVCAGVPCKVIGSFEDFVENLTKKYKNLKKKTI